MSTMKNKWEALDSETIASVQMLLAECARPVVSRMRTSGVGGGEAAGGTASERRQELARQAIAGVTRRLRSKLVKGIPFPPATVSTAPSRGSGAKRAKSKSGNGGGGGGSASREADFNFERVAEGAQALEQQLTPLQHAIALLERERKREEDALEADYATLRELETNAQAEMRTWRERTRRAHVLTPVDDGKGTAQRPGVQVELVEQPRRRPAAPGEDDSGDNEGLFEVRLFFPFTF